MKKHTMATRDVNITMEDTPFMVVEAYKSLRTNLLFAMSTSKRKTIVITSAQPGEGKSTIALNLSFVFSEAKYKTLLIDGDFRKPILHKRLKLKNTVGLSNVLAGFTEENESIVHYAENLHVIPAGEIPPNPSELLGSPIMEQFLQRMEEKYDYIVIDTPPSIVVTDSIAVASLSAGIVLVMREGTTVHPCAEKVLSQMEFAGIKVLGIVLNNVRGASVSKLGGYKRYSSHLYKQTYGT